MLARQTWLMNGNIQCEVMGSARFSNIKMPICTFGSGVGFRFSEGLGALAWWSPFWRPSRTSARRGRVSSVTTLIVRGGRARSSSSTKSGGGPGGKSVSCANLSLRGRQNIWYSSGESYCFRRTEIWDGLTCWKNQHRCATVWQLEHCTHL